METGKRRGKRIGATGTALVSMPLLFSLVLPGNAAAQETDPVFADECPLLIESEDGDRAPLDPTSPDLGLGFPGIGADEFPGLGMPTALSIPDLDDADSINEWVEELCDSEENIADELTKPVLEVLAENGIFPVPSDPQEGEVDDGENGDDDYTGATTEPADPPLPPATSPEVTESSDTSAVPAPPSGPTAPSSDTEADGGGWARVTIDPPVDSTTESPSSTQADRGGEFTAEHRDTRAENDTSAVERLPLLLAVIALVLVAAALVHTWARRLLLR